MQVFLLLIYLIGFTDIPAANILDCQIIYTVLYTCIILFFYFFLNSFVFALVFVRTNSNEQVQYMS